ncbi:hypothetical protein LguiB_018268 [Lonicera macranthoides]
MEVDCTFLNSQDGESNTILHKVVALKQLEVKLKYCKAEFLFNSWLVFFLVGWLFSKN